MEQPIIESILINLLNYGNWSNMPNSKMHSKNLNLFINNIVNGLEIFNIDTIRYQKLFKINS